MHIMNVMFSRNLGGIEQALVDYCEAIKGQGHQVTAIIYPKAAIKTKLMDLKINIIEVKNLGSWDFMAKNYLAKIIRQTNPDAIITHGNRAISLVKKPAGIIPVIGVTHNYNIKHLIGLNEIFATTTDLKEKVIEAGQDESKIHLIPNMIRIPTELPAIKDYHNPVTIGTMGRFVKKKGFDVFIRAISRLNNVKAIIGGSGDEENSLRQLSSSLGLDDIIEFTGWVDNKQEFFDKIDIFCLPSHHEPFGIILLEAFISACPVITTASEGPSEIATDGKDAIITALNDNEAMTKAIEDLINNPEKSRELAENAIKTAQTYEISNVGQRICAAL